MPTIDQYFERYRELSKSASELARQLNFAGLGVIWIFKLDTPAGVALPHSLIVPVAWIVVSLLLDLLQYVVGALIWNLYGRHLENLERAAAKTKSPFGKDHVFKNKKWMANVLSCFYYGKVASLCVAYGYIGLYLWTHIIATRSV